MKKKVSNEDVYRLLHPRQVVLVTSIGESGEPNIMPVAWSTPLSFSPPLVGVSVGFQRYSHKLIIESGEFVINIPGVELALKVQECGRVSGRTHAKFEEVGLTPKPSKKLKTPIVEECLAHLECKLFKSLEVGDHTFFVGRVVEAYADEKVFKRGVFDLNKAKILYHVGGSSFTTLSDRLLNGGDVSA